jgi:plastocyanin
MHMRCARALVVLTSLLAVVACGRAASTARGEGDGGMTAGEAGEAEDVLPLRIRLPDTGANHDTVAPPAADADAPRSPAPADGRPPGATDARATVDAAPATDGLHRVTVENYRFTPLDLTIRAGESIEWVSNPAVAQPGIHLPTSATDRFVPDGAWKAPDLIGPGHLKRFVHRFDEPGTFHVMCTTNASHLGQRGEHQTITVSP